MHPFQQLHRGRKPYARTSHGQVEQPACDVKADPHEPASNFDLRPHTRLATALRPQLGSEFQVGQSHRLWDHDAAATFRPRATRDFAQCIAWPWHRASAFSAPEFHADAGNSVRRWISFRIVVRRIAHLATRGRNGLEVRRDSNEIWCTHGAHLAGHEYSTRDVAIGEKEVRTRQPPPKDHVNRHSPATATKPIYPDLQSGFRNRDFPCASLSCR